jgi:hypothetical protein
MEEDMEKAATVPLFLGRVHEPTIDFRPSLHEEQSAYRHKFSKFVDENGGRPILEVEPVEPWHVKKVLMEK